MQKYLVPALAAFVVAFAINFGFSAFLASAGARDDNTGLLVGMVFGGLTALAVYNLSGNRRTANAGAEARQRALAFTPTPGKAALYLVRTGFVGKMAGMDLTIDGRAVAQLKSPRFTRIDIMPGAHTLTASFGGGLAGQTKPADLAFNCAEGETVVIKLSMSMGALKSPVNIERTSIESVRDQLRSMRMTAPEADAP